MKRLTAFVLSVLVFFTPFPRTSRGSTVRADSGLVLAGQGNYESIKTSLPNVSVACPDSSNPNGMYLCDSEGDLYYSSDSLKTFKYRGKLPSPICSLSVDPFKPSMIYGSNLYTNDKEKLNIYISSDSGENWSTLFTFSITDTCKILVNSKEEGQVLVKTNSFLFLSNDRGNTFEKIFDVAAYSQSDKATSISSVAISNDGTNSRLFLYTDGGIFASDNLGKTWKKIFDQAYGNYRELVAVDPSNSSII